VDEERFLPLFSRKLGLRLPTPPRPTPL